jgi:LacI family transcriptional regulator
MPGRVRGAVTLEDVARVAGVSLGTASRALNGRSGVNPETVQRVRAAAERLGYQPSAVARGLRSGRTFTVGLITTDLFGRFSIPVMLGAEDALGAGQISVLLCDSRDDPIRERHHLRILLERRVDGIIVAGRRTDPRPPIGHNLPVPVVYAMTKSEDPDDCSVVPDDFGGGGIAATHLLSVGRSRIAHITGPERFEAARQRADAFSRVLGEAGLTLAGGAPQFGEWTEEWGRYATYAALRATPDLDAIFCGSDQIARGAADIVREQGLRIPGDVAVLGFDNWEVMAVACRPPLTTIDMNLREVGRQAASFLLRAIDGDPQEGVHTVPCTLVLRQSTDITTPLPN